MPGAGPLTLDPPMTEHRMLSHLRGIAERNEVFDHKGRFDVLYRKAYGSR